ncbi:hypothetical protein quinque_014217 [Culex quinquefasciatus]
MSTRGRATTTRSSYTASTTREPREREDQDGSTKRQTGQNSLTRSADRTQRTPNRLKRRSSQLRKPAFYKTRPRWGVKRSIGGARCRLRKMDDNHPNKAQALVAFKEARNATRKTIAKARTDRWTSFVTGISPSSNTTEIWRRVNTFRNGPKVSIHQLVIDGKLVDEPEKVAETLADYFAKVSTAKAPTYQRAVPDQPTPKFEGGDEVATKNDTTRTSAWRNWTGPSESRKGCQPESSNGWSTGESSQPSELGVHGDDQHGFRRGKGVDTYLAELEYQIEEWIGKRQHGELAMLDLAMAYDTAERIPILHNLHRWGIRPDGSKPPRKTEPTEVGPIENVKHARLLGATFDGRFNWRQHISETKENIECRNRIRRVIGQSPEGHSWTCIERLSSPGCFMLGAYSAQQHQPPSGHSDQLTWPESEALPETSGPARARRFTPSPGNYPSNMPQLRQR